MKKMHLILILITFVFCGCAAPKMTGVPETLALKEPPRIDLPEPKPEPPKEEYLPPSKEQGLFSLSVRDADIRDVFLLLSKDSGMNIIADRDIAGKISIDFSNLTLNSALYAITRQLGYTFRMDKGFIRVTKPVLETRAFNINYIMGKRTSTSTMNAAISAGSSSSGQAAGSSTNINISSGATPSSGSGSQTSSSGQGNVNITTSGTTDFWKEVIRGLEVIVFGDAKGGSGGDGGYSRGDEKTGKKLIVSELAGIVHITDYSDNIERLEDFINDVERAVRKQVMIQAHILEVLLRDGYSFGIDWKALTVSGKESFSISQNLTPQILTGILQLDYKLTLGNKQVDALLDAMKEQGQINVLSSPKVSTLNNQKAVIKLSTKEVSWITNSFLNAEGNVLLSYTSPQIDEVGLFLDVTPQIDDKGIITMQIHPSISETKGISESPDKKSSKPVIDVREVDTMIKARNGQTIVIAGLITDKVSDNIKKIPFLGDVPVLGTLFKQTVQEKRKSEMVIMLTPYILTDQSVEDIRKEHEERLRKAGRVLEPVPFISFERAEAKK